MYFYRVKVFVIAMSYYKVFGRKPDGSIDVCRAKPEHRGRGTCKHVEHLSNTTNLTDKEFISKYTEEYLERNFSNTAKLTPKEKDYPHNVTDDKIKTSKNGTVISKEELLNGATAIANQFNQEDFLFMKDFYNKFEKEIKKTIVNKKEKSIVDNVSSFLKSDDDTVIMVRDFLGKDIDLDDFSSILAHNVGAMTCAEKFYAQRNNSIRRIVLSSVDNDMTKERYVASVLFFGGRCCYCNTPLKKNPPPRSQASGEHLTPISPERKNQIHGATRYGNMALACVLCNRNRENKELVEWLQKTRRVKKEDKPAVLGRIQAFRKFALYHEYTPQENARIVKTINELDEYIKSFKKPNGTYQDNVNEKIRSKIKIMLYNLKHGE